MPLLYVIRCFFHFLKLVLAIVKSKANEKSKIVLPSAFAYPRSYPLRKLLYPLYSLLR